MARVKSDSLNEEKEMCIRDRTTAYHIAGYEIGSGMISYVSAGLWPNALLVFVANILSVPGLLILTAVALGVLYYVNKIRKAQA